MPNDKSRKTITRRDALGTLGALGVMTLVGARPLRAKTIRGSCTLAPKQTIGPYFVDEGLKRSDIRQGTGSDTVFITGAVPLYLSIDTVSTTSPGCPPLRNVQIDLWHCHAGGLYSDEQANGTLGQNWLRGYQMTDENGRVSFTTIYPGWYPGRTIHIHLMARYYNSVGNTTYQFTTQLYFDDSISDTVLANYPYNTRGDRTTTNANDGIFASSMILDVQPTDGGKAYTGAIALGLALEDNALADVIFDDGFEIS